MGYIYAHKSTLILTFTMGNVVFGGFPEIKYFDVFKPSILMT